MPEPVGYRIYYGTSSGQYDQFIEVGADPSAQISGLDERVTYFFVVTALDEGGLEGQPSEEIFWNSFTDEYPQIASWLIEHGVADRAEDILEQDLDGDGAAVWQEYIMDTNPSDPESHLRLVRVAPIYGPSYEVVSTNTEPPYDVITQTVAPIIGYEMKWDCSVNRLYDVQYSLDLVNDVWAPLDGLSGIMPTSGEMVVTNMIGEEPLKMVRLVVRHP